MWCISAANLTGARGVFAAKAGQRRKEAAIEGLHSVRTLDDDAADETGTEVAAAGETGDTYALVC